MTSKNSIIKITTMIVGLLVSFPAGAKFGLQNYNLLAVTPGEFSCNSYVQNCWNEATQFLSPFSTSTLPTEDDHLAVQGALIRTVGHRSSLVILAIHGLYDNSTQFNTELQQAQQMGINSLSITLPGHGPFAKDYNKVKYYDWQKATRDGLNLALAMGDKVVVLGQSTGALLLYELQLENPEQKIAAGILIEPAILLHSYFAQIACNLKDIIKTAQEVPDFAKLFGYDDVQDTEQPISLNLGCQVSRLEKSLLHRYLPKEMQMENTAGPEFVRSKYAALLANKIPPNLIGHTSTDNMLVDSVNQLLIQLQGENVSSYDEAKILGHDVDHGEETQMELTRPIKAGLTGYENDKLGIFLLSIFPNLKEEFDQAWAGSRN